MDYVHLLYAISFHFTLTFFVPLSPVPLVTLAARFNQARNARVSRVAREHAGDPVDWNSIVVAN